jgi:hypothetical protein
MTIDPASMEEAERLLPRINPEYLDGCFGNNGGVHWKDCPVNFRPAVIRRAQRDRIVALEAEVSALKPQQSTIRRMALEEACAVVEAYAGEQNKTVMTRPVIRAIRALIDRGEG